VRTAVRILTVAAPLAALLGGCIIETAPTGPITVELVNETSLDVQPRLYTSGSATDAAGLFVGANLRTDFTGRPFPELRADEAVSLTLECDDASSIGVRNPVMFDAVQLIVTNSDDQLFLLRDTDFQCGTTVRFVYYTDGDDFRVRVETP
jgi:hypothetical protein